MVRNKEVDKAYYLANRDKILARQREKYLLNKDKINERHKKYNLEHKDMQVASRNKWYSNHRFEAAINKAAQNKKEFLLSKEEYYSEICKPCYYCNDLLNTDKGFGIGLDRIDCSIGYRSNNIVSCCGTCNRIKGDNLSQAETKVAVEAILRFRGNKI